MARRYRFASLIAALMFAVACTQSHTPIGPSAISAPAPSGGSTSALSTWAPLSQRESVVDWACFTIGTGCAQLVPPLGSVGQDAPGAPSNLAFQVSGTTVILTWSPPGSGGAVGSYVIEAGTGPGLSNIASFNTGSTATTLTVTSVPAGTYIVRVRARNADGTSSASNEVTIVVSTGPCPPPGAPAGLTATVSGNAVTLQWNAFTGAITYIIEAGSSAGATNVIVFETGSAATSFTGNAPAGTYFIRIRVRTACGTSGVSNEVVATVGGGGGGGLSGYWRGTLTITQGSRPPRSQDIEIDFIHSGTRLTGAVRNPPPGGSITIDTTQSPTNPSVYTGTVRVTPQENPACSEISSGSFSVLSPTTMQGSFTRPATSVCVSETADLTLQKVS